MPEPLPTPLDRPRRTRRTATLRRMVRETTLSVDDFIAPLFIAQGQNVLKPISSMPGHAQRSLDHLDAEIDELSELGIPAVLLFGIPLHKDASGTGAWDPDGPVPSAIRAIKRRAPEMAVVAYKTLPDPQAAELAALLGAGRVDAVTFTSSSTVRYTVEALLGAGVADPAALLNTAVIASIGPITSQTARELGLRVGLEAAEHTTDGLIAALMIYFQPSEG